MLFLAITPPRGYAVKQVKKTASADISAMLCADCNKKRGDEMVQLTITFVDYSVSEDTGKISYIYSAHVNNDDMYDVCFRCRKNEIRHELEKQCKWFGSGGVGDAVPEDQMSKFALIADTVRNNGIYYNATNTIIRRLRETTLNDSDKELILKLITLARDTLQFISTIPHNNYNH